MSIVIKNVRVVNYDKSSVTGSVALKPENLNSAFFSHQFIAFPTPHHSPKMLSSNYRTSNSSFYLNNSSKYRTHHYCYYSLLLLLKAEFIRMQQLLWSNITPNIMVLSKPPLDRLVKIAASSGGTRRDITETFFRNLFI